MSTIEKPPSRLKLFLTLSLLVLSLYSIVVRTQYNTRNTRAQIGPGTCPTTSTNTYASWDIDNNSAATSWPAATHPDKNLQVRGYVAAPDSGQIYNNNEAIDNKSPQLSTMFDSLPSVGSVYKVYDWSWGANNTLGSKGALLGITALGVQPAAEVPVRVPDAQFDLITGTATSGGYTAIVLYADATSITLKYTLQDDVVSHYTVHIDNICTDPNLLTLYNQLDAGKLAGSEVRDFLPILKGKDIIGLTQKALLAGSTTAPEVKVAVRNSGQFIDPRWINSWWRGVAALPVGVVQPTPTAAPPACTVPPNAPVITAPANSSIPPGNFTIAWNPSASATSYALRIDDGSNPFTNNCTLTQNPGDICIDSLTSTSYSYTFQANADGSPRSYRIWIHALNACGGWNSASNLSITVANNVTIAPTTTTCTTAPPPVQIVSPANATINEGSYEVAWTPSSCAATYHVRIDDLTTPWIDVFPCDPAQLQPGDACIDNLTATTMGQYNFVQGHTYRIWVHAVNNNLGWNVVGSKTVFTVAPGPTANECIVQGFKLPDFSANPGGNYWTYKPEIANAPVGIMGQNVVIPPPTSSTANPYFLRVPGNNIYTVDIQPPPGYTVESTSCENSTTCHSSTDPSRRQGATRTNVFCPAGGWTDLWWHFVPQASPTPPCTVPGTPVAGPTSRVDNQLTADPTDDQVNFSWNPATGTPNLSDRYHVWLKDNPLDIWHDQGFIPYNVYTKIADKAQTVGIQITAASACGESAPIEIWSTVAGAPTPTPGAPATPTACLGVQHCQMPNGSSMMFSYCGACSGAGCDPGYVCKDPRYTCKTFPNKVFYFDTVYQIPCSILTPTVAPAAPTATSAPGTGPTFAPSRSRAVAIAAAGALIAIVIIVAVMMGV